MSVIVFLVLFTFIGVDPSSGVTGFTVDQRPTQMTLEQCIERATTLNNDTTNPYTAACIPPNTQTDTKS